jgi:hypothetical protein
MSKAFTAFVWVAGPISGMFVQPYVGVRSDNCRVSFGRRKPFMIGGALATIVSVMFFVWAKKIITALLSVFGVGEDSKGTKIGTIVFSVICFYVLDFAINTCESSRLKSRINSTDHREIKYKRPFEPSSLIMHPRTSKKTPMRGPVAFPESAISLATRLGSQTWWQLCHSLVTCKSESLV